ncbi:class I adenylate-forming enzyme family protein [Streptomyces sparsogenes]|uniref:class I adenylate-forming enzyme family protein n=1 Tax=Streptomyces sparsogenes TaxID=67365 RepID=UPI00341141AA
MSSGPAPSLVHEIFDEAARRWPHRPAVTSDGVTLTHAELASAGRRVAARLTASGVRPGQRVLVGAATSPLLPAVVYAASRAGAVFSLLHEQVRGPQLAHILDDSEPALLISDREQNLASAAGKGVSTVDARDLARHVFAEGDGGAREGAEEVPAAGRLTVDPVSMIYTSGTTALPKAVVGTHQQVLFAADAIQRVLRYRPDDTVYSPLPLSFDYGLYQLFLGALSGAHVWLGRPTDIGPPLLTHLARSRATVLPAVPSVADALARLLHRSGRSNHELRLLTNTGAAMPQQTLEELRSACPNLRVQLMFGLTECKRATIMPVDGDLARPGSSGRALPGTEVFVVDEEGERQPPGTAGEIAVRGPHVMSGYWRRPELTARRFPRREGLFPELRTGDYGWLDDEGYLYVTGRRDDLYKAGGFRVSAAEVEAAARRVPGVRTAALLPPGAGRPPLLFVTGEVTAAGVLHAMREQIEEFKIPSHCSVLDTLPLTGNGKVDRKALAASALEAHDARPQ